MMRNLSNENFERFLRQNADGLHMQPSHKVWKGVSGYLNRRRWRFGIFVGVALLVTTGMGYYYTNSQDINTNSRQQSSLVKDPAHAGSLNSIAFDQKKNQFAVQSGTPALSESVRKHTSANENLNNNLPDYTSVAIAYQVQNTSDNSFTPTVVDEYPQANSTEQKTFTESVMKQAKDPQTIESVMNAYNRRVSNGRFGLQLYFTPTVSYRKLNDNNIDNVVIHKPDFGFEMGIAAKYKVGRNVKLRGGVQFNVNRYDIKTYNSTTQMATFRLTNRFGFDSVNTVTNYNNFSGYKSNWLENFFFQVSAPIGLEIRLKGDDRTQFGVASTIQPTYILGDRAYLISSDYKNYAEVPRLIRRWNLNTSFETFVAYSTGRLKWQAGPQIRYQILSSYLTKYPVKENLFDYGLKIGVSLNNR
jgi:hypothetical protein